MRIHKLLLLKRAKTGCFVTLALLSLLLSNISAQNQSGKVRVTMTQPYFAGTYGSCILIEREQSREPEQKSNSINSDARKYELTDKIVAGHDNRAPEANLAPGVYRIRVRSRGFEEFTSESFELSSGETKAFDVTLKVPIHAQFGIPEPPLEDPLVTAEAKGTKRLLPFKTLLISDSSGIRERQNVVVTNTLDWENLWNKIYARHIPQRPAANIDFKNKIVIASSFGEMNTGGFGIEIIRAVETDDAVEIWVRTHSAGGGAVTLAFTQPIHVIEMERVDKKIAFVRPRFQSPCL